MKNKYFNIFVAMALIVSLIIPNISFAYEIIGKESEPTLTIHKFEQEPNTPEGDAGTGLPGQDATGTEVEGVEFTLTQTHRYDAENDVWEEVTDGKVITGETGENGQVVFTEADGLELGRYRVEETKWPEHIIPNPEAYFVDIPMTSNDGTTLIYDVHIYPKNEIIRGDAELIKQNTNGNAMEGVVFGLYQITDEKVVKLGQLTTNAEGKITFNNLPAGKYYFQEIATLEGYALNTTRIQFEVTRDGQESVVIWTDSNINDENVVTNYEKPKIEKDVEGSTHFDVDRDQEYTYNLTIKVPEDIQNYKALGVTDTLDDRLQYNGTWEATGSTENIENYITFKNNGQTLIWEVDPSKLQPGETVVISFTAKINKNANLVGEETGIPNVANIHFNNGKGSYTTPADPENPDPYKPYDPEDPDDPSNPFEPEDPDKPEPPTREEPPQTPPVTVTPQEGGLKVIKVDSSNENITLAGAEFKLTTDKEGENIFDATGTVITVNGEAFTGKLENLITGENGEFTIEGLTPGVYYLHETKAPTYEDEEGNVKSYRLLTKPIEVEISNNELVSKTVKNSKYAWKLPTTGGIGTTLFTIVGLTLMGIALIAYIRRRKLMEQ